jgi:hypothetical protein
MAPGRPSEVLRLSLGSLREETRGKVLIEVLNGIALIDLFKPTVAWS